MSLKIQLEDGTGKGTFAKINGEGELAVVVHPHPPLDEKIESLPFRQYFTTTGDSSGNNRMDVDGSVTPIDYYIQASPDFDTYIKTITIEISDTGTPNLNKFGNLTALANGVEWIWFNQEFGEYELHEGIKQNKEFIRIASGTKAVGTGVDAFLSDVSGGGTTKSYFPIINIERTYSLLYGLRLKKGSTDKIIFRINDDLSTLTTFNAVGNGIRINL